MKNLCEYVKESIVNEKFGSQIVGDFIKGNYNDKLLKFRLMHFMMWDKIPDSDVEVVDLKTGCKALTDSNVFVVFKFDKEIVAYAYDEVFRASKEFSKIKTLTGLIRKIKNSQCLVINNYDKYDTSDLIKARNEAQEGAVALQDADDILYNNKKRYERLLPVFKANRRLDFSQLQMKYDKVTNTLMKVINVMRHNEDLLLGHGHGLYNDESGLERIVQKYQAIIQTINTLTGKDTKARDRIGMTPSDVEFVKRTVDDFRNGTLDDEDISYYQEKIINRWINDFDSLDEMIWEFCEVCEISDEDLRMTNIADRWI